MLPCRCYLWSAVIRQSFCKRCGLSNMIYHGKSTAACTWPQEAEWGFHRLAVLPLPGSAVWADRTQNEPHLLCASLGVTGHSSYRMKTVIALPMFASLPAEKWQDYWRGRKGRANHVRIARVRLATAVMPLSRRMTMTCNVV
jgi:hypothetical protein